MYSYLPTNQETVALPRKNPILKYFYTATRNGASKENVKLVFHEPGKENGRSIYKTKYWKL